MAHSPGSIAQQPAFPPAAPAIGRVPSGTDQVQTMHAASSLLLQSFAIQHIVITCIMAPNGIARAIRMNNAGCCNAARAGGGIRVRANIRVPENGDGIGAASSPLQLGLCRTSTSQSFVRCSDERRRVCLILAALKANRKHDHEHVRLF